jgi:hypothetical protein
VLPSENEPPIPQLPAADDSCETTLAEGLSDSIEHVDAHSKYIPIDKQLDVLTEDGIREELMMIAKRHPEFNIGGNLDYWTAKLFKRVACNDGKQYTARRILLAILILCGCPEQIFNFIDENLYDKDLPFDCDQAQASGSSQGPDGVFKPLRKVKAISKLPKHYRRTFHQYQWYFMAPYFKMEDGKVRFYKLMDMVPLPFLDTHVKNEITTAGFSQVHKVQIHPAHHNYQWLDIAVSKPELALTTSLRLLLTWLRNRMPWENPPRNRSASLL